jgi:hypothetical protein
MELTYGPRDIANVSWAVFLVLFILCPHLCLLHLFFMCHSCYAIAIPLHAIAILLFLLLVLPLSGVGPGVVAQ